MDALRKPSIRKLNPGMLQSDDEVREQFVVRRHELAIVLEVLRGNIEASSCQHVLVVAPRGRGKTMLLARVAAELHTDAVLSEHLLPVRFMEESQEIFTLADFWLETLFHLARESAAYDPELAREVRETHADLVGRWNEETLGERALAAVLRAANRLGKQLVLMVENLQALCDTVDDDFGWKLREVLQSEPQIMLLATATSRFKGLTSRFKELDDAQQPFFELFRTVDLEPLSTEECQELWRVISGDEVSEREMRPLEILTGGSPRLLVIVAGFGQHRSLLQLMEELVTLIDEHTEYFRSNMEVLPKTERRVYIAVIDLWQPSTTGQIATRARLDVRTVSTMLGRLTDRGAVIWKGSGKKRQYVAAERLYSIYYKLRRERDEAAVVQNLIRFMVAFYSEDELAEMSGEFIAEAAQSPAIREGIERVVAELPELNSVFSGMRRPAMERPQPDKAELSIALEGATLSVSATVTNNGSAEQLLQELLTAFDGGEFRKVTKIVDQAFTARSENWFRVPESWIAHAFLMKARAYRKLDDSRAAIAGFDEVFERFASSNTPGIQTQVAWALSDKGEVEREQGELTAAIATYDKTVAHFGASDAPGDRVWVVQALSDKGEVQRERGELADAIATYDEVIARFGVSDAPGDQEWVAWALTGKGDIQREQGELTAAIATYEEVIARFGTSNAPHLQMPVAWASTNKGNAQWQLGELTAAIASYDETIARFGTSNVPEVQIPVAWALTNKGDAQRQLGELAAAMATYDEVIACFGASDTPAVQARVAGALTGKGNMQRERGELTTAIVSYEEVVARFGTSNAPEVQEWVAWALSNKGDTQRQLGELAATMATYDEVITRFGTSDAPAVQERVAWALGNKGNAQRQLGELATAIATYDEVITRFGTSDFPQLQEWVAWALGQKGDTQRQLGELAAAMATWDEVIARFGASDAPAVQAQVAWTLSNKGYIQREQGELAAAIVTYDEVITRFGTSDAPAVQERVAWALGNKGNAQRQLGELATAIATYDEVITRFGTSDFPQLQEWVAWALGQKGDTQRQLGELAAAMATWDEVIARFGASDAPAVQAQVAWTLSNKGYIQREQGELAAAIVTYDEVIARFGTSDVPQLQEWVAWALSKKGEVQTERGHAEEALHTCEELERRLDTLTGSEKAMFEWQVRWVRAKALLVQENSRAAMEAFRSAYDVFVPDYITVSEMLRLVPDLIALGASVPDLVEILSSDKAKSDTLVPLIVALREYHTGEAERAPEEVREVAADIIERIEQRIEVRALKGGSSAS